MAIKGLTHRLDGTVNTRLAIDTKFAIGITETLEGGKTRPKKLDYILAERKNAKGEWVEDLELEQTLRESYSRKTENGYTPLREFDVVFLSDDIEEIFPTKYAMWSASELQCSGDGEHAMRSVSIIKDKDLLAASPKERYLPWHPCGDTCPEKIAKKCKPSGQLFFMVLIRPVLGAVSVFYTTSYRTILQIYSSLTQIKQLTGGRLKGIPFRLVMRPGRTSYQDKDGQRRNSNAFFINIEFRQADHSRLLPALFEASIQYDKARLEQAKELKRLGPAVKMLAEDAEVIESLPDEEVAAHMAQFQSNDDEQDEDDDTPQQPAADLSAIDTICKAWGISQARRDVVLGCFEGDAAKTTQWFESAAKEFNRLNLSAQSVNDLFQHMGMRPDELLKHVAALGGQTTQPQAEPTPRRPRRTQAQMKEAAAEKPAPPSAEEKPAETPKPADPKPEPPVAATPDAGTFNF